MNPDVKNTFSRVTLLGYKDRTWQFEELPTKSIALDGAVQGSFFDPISERFSFDHHGTNRICSRSACSQTLHAILTGLNPTGYRVFFSHLDCDVVLAICLLKYPELAWFEDVVNFVEIAGLSDNFGPAYPKSTKMSTLLWTFHTKVLYPLITLKSSGKYNRIRDLRNLASQLAQDARDFIVSEIIPNSEALRKLYRPNTENLVFLETSGSVIKKLYERGIAGGIVYRGPEGARKFTVFKRTEFSLPGVDLLSLATRLSQLEPGWGGTSTLCCSPKNGSELDPKLVWNIFKEEN